MTRKVWTDRICSNCEHYKKSEVSDLNIELMAICRDELSEHKDSLVDYDRPACERFKRAHVGRQGGLPLQNSAEAIDAREEIAKAAGVSHDTMAKAKVLAAVDTP